MEFKCTVCDYTSYQKHHLTRHITKKNKCGKNPQIVKLDVEISCEHCGNQFKSQTTLKRHYKVCKVLGDIEKEQLRKENEELRAKLEEERSKPKTTVNIQNLNIQINGYRQTSFDHLTDRDYKRAVGRMVYSVPQMIEDVHFNNKAPHNHNIFISNIKGKYVMVYDGEKWCSKLQDQVIDQLINDQEYAMEEWLGEGNRFPKEMRKFNEYLEKKEAHGDELKCLIKEEVKLLLYNNRDKVRTNKCNKTT